MGSPVLIGGNHSAKLRTEMEADADAGTKPVEGTRDEAQSFPPPLPTRIRTSLLACAAGYAVVALFAVAFAVVDAGWISLSITTKATIAAIVAAPLAFGMLWPRLSGFSAFGFEVSLTQASAKEAQVPGAITEETYLSGSVEIMKLVKRLVDRPDVRALEINLRDGSYWWPSRLYLVAALAADFSHVQAIAFVEGGKERIFVGTAAPAAVRSALSLTFPSFEKKYAGAKEFAVVQSGAVGGMAARIPESFATGPLSVDGKEIPEEELPRVSSERLREWLRPVGVELDTRCIEWRGISEPELVRAAVTEFDGPIVPLVRARLRLDRLVDRLELARRLT